MFTFNNSIISEEIIESRDVIKCLKSKWNEIHDKTAAFRYKIENLKERIVDEMYLLQLNPNRKSKRRTPENIMNVTQEFDKNKFNFTKVSTEEIIFTFKDIESEDIHVVLINDSPISQYHSLICPSMHKCLPQIINKHSLNIVLNLMYVAQDREIRIGFNSLCAQASVNHLHYHMFIEKTKLPIEEVACKHIKGPLYQLADTYPIPAFCFEGSNNSQNVNEIYKLLDYFIQKSIAHNVFITFGKGIDGKSEKVLRVIVWPRKSSSGVKQLSAFNVAVCELSGWFPVYNADDFVNLQSDILENELKKWKIENFEELCEDVKLLY